MIPLVNAMSICGRAVLCVGDTLVGLRTESMLMDDNRDAVVGGGS